jgi:hypothetical protein
MRLSFDPLQNAIPQSLHDYLEARRTYPATLRWMALAGAKLPNSDTLITEHLKRCAPRHTISSQSKRFFVDDTSALGVSLQHLRSLIPIDYSYLLEALCIVFWESDTKQGLVVTSSQLNQMTAKDSRPTAITALPGPTTTSLPMAVDPPGNKTGNRYLDLFLDEDGAFPLQRP